MERDQESLPVRCEETHLTLRALAGTSRSGCLALEIGQDPDWLDDAVRESDVAHLAHPGDDRIPEPRQQSLELSE